MTVFVIRDTLAQQTYDVTSTFTSCILNYLNNRFHCSPNNSLLSFSANDWLKFVAAILNFNSAPDWLKFQVAILDLENIRFHSSPNNCLLPFSAPDWLLPKPSGYTTDVAGKMDFGYERAGNASHLQTGFVNKWRRLFIEVRFDFRNDGGKKIYDIIQWYL